MEPSPASSPSPVTVTATANLEQNLRHLPVEARQDYLRFQDTGDLAALDRVVLAILSDFAPRSTSCPVAEMSGQSRLIEDLRFDSLAITEVVFFTEDLFGIRIANDEILQVRTLDDLRQFVRRKVAARPAA